MLLYIVYGILFVNTVNTKIKACNALNAMFVNTVDILVFVALTQNLIQSTIHLVFEMFSSKQREKQPHKGLRWFK